MITLLASLMFTLAACDGVSDPADGGKPDFIDCELPDSASEDAEVPADIEIRNPDDIDEEEILGGADGFPGEGQTDEFEYTVLDETVIINNYIGKGEDVIIPAEIQGISVTAIGGGAFSSQKSLRSVTMPDGATTIGGNAFMGCTALKSVTMPDSVTTIGRGAFSGCTSLKTFNIPDGVTEIAGNAFEGCKSLDKEIVEKILGINPEVTF